MLKARLLETHTLDGHAVEDPSFGWPEAIAAAGRSCWPILFSSLLKRQAGRDHFYEYTVPFHGANSLQSIHQGFPRRMNQDSAG
jgi:hypothetical protein